MENLPSEINRFAKFEIIYEKSEEQDLSSEVGMKSIGEDLHDDLVMWLNTSGVVSMWNVLSGWSDVSVGWRNIMTLW